MGKVIAVGLSWFFAALLFFAGLAIWLSPAQAQNIPAWLDPAVPCEIITEDAQIDKASGKMYLLFPNPDPTGDTFCAVINFNEMIGVRYKVAPNGASKTRPVYDLKKYQDCRAAGGTDATCPLGTKIGDVVINLPCNPTEIRKTNYRIVPGTYKDGKAGMAICNPEPYNDFKKVGKMKCTAYARLYPINSLTAAEKLKCGHVAPQPTPQPAPTPTPTAAPDFTIQGLPATASGRIVVEAKATGVTKVDAFWFYRLDPTADCKTGQATQIGASGEFGAPYILNGDAGFDTNAAFFCGSSTCPKLANGPHKLKVFLQHDGWKNGPEKCFDFAVSN